MLFLVPCSNLTKPENGMMNCSLGDDRVLSYEDICNFTCNDGYKLNGNETTFCQSNGSWTANEPCCNNGSYTAIQCSYMFV